MNNPRSFPRHTVGPKPRGSCVGCGVSREVLEELEELSTAYREQEATRVRYVQALDRGDEAGADKIQNTERTPATARVFRAIATLKSAILRTKGV